MKKSICALLGLSGRCEKAALFNPKNEEALYNAATTLIKISRAQESIGYLDRILDISPENLDALNYKGIAFCTLEMYREALKAFGEMLFGHHLTSLQLQDKFPWMS